MEKLGLDLSTYQWLGASETPLSAYLTWLFWGSDEIAQENCTAKPTVRIPQFYFTSPCWFSFDSHKNHMPHTSSVQMKCSERLRSKATQRTQSSAGNKAFWTPMLGSFLCPTLPLYSGVLGQNLEGRKHLQTQPELLPVPAGFCCTLSWLSVWAWTMWHLLYHLANVSSNSSVPFSLDILIVAFLVYKYIQSILVISIYIKT